MTLPSEGKNIYKSIDLFAVDGASAKTHRVFSVYFRYFQTVNIEPKIIDWVFNVLCFILRLSGSRVRVLELAYHLQLEQNVLEVEPMPP